MTVNNKSLWPALNQRVLGSSPSASTKLHMQNHAFKRRFARRAKRFCVALVFSGFLATRRVLLKMATTTHDSASHRGKREALAASDREEVPAPAAGCDMLMTEVGFLDLRRGRTGRAPLRRFNLRHAQRLSLIVNLRALGALRLDYSADGARFSSTPLGGGAARAVRAALGRARAMPPTTAG